MQRFNDSTIQQIINRRVPRGEHGGETGDFFLAAADGARLFKLPAGAHGLKRAFAVNFFLQSPQRTVHRFAFFQFDLCQCTHFLSGAGDNCHGQFPQKLRNAENRFLAREVNE